MHRGEAHKSCPWEAKTNLTEAQAEFVEARVKNSGSTPTVSAYLRYLVARDMFDTKDTP